MCNEPAVPMVIGIAGSAFSVWLIRWQQFSVVQHQSRLLFYTWDSRAGILPAQFLCIPWFAFYLRKPGNKSIENPLLSHPYAIPSHKIGSALIVWLICFRSFSVVKYRPGLLFCIWGSTVGNLVPLYPRILWFGFCCHRWGIESISHFLDLYSFIVPSYVISCDGQFHISRGMA